MTPATDLPNTRYLFFAGKGGVGKTTAACAAALRLWDRADDGESVVLLSTDPAPTLYRSLGVDPQSGVAAVDRRGSAALCVHEIEASAALDRFRSENRAIVAEILERGTLLDEQDASSLLELSFPGLDEVIALLEVGDIAGDESIGHVVVDTAPTGHTLRLLRSPTVLARWIQALDRIAEKDRYIRAHFAPRRGGEDEVDRFLRELAARVIQVHDLLRDAERAAVILVTVPEAMVVDETLRYCRSLDQDGIHPAQVLVNRVELGRPDCPFCEHRSSEQTRWVEAIDETTLPCTAVRAVHSGEVRGQKALRMFGEEAWGIQTPWQALALNTAPRFSISMDPTGPGFPIPLRRLLLFAGKGGVGKTTAAASTAIALADQDPGNRVLLLSIDPAHSLADSLDAEFGEFSDGVAGIANLSAMQIDAEARFKRLKERYGEWVDGLFAPSQGSRWSVRFEREAMAELMALAPPGIDELAALSVLSELLEEGRYGTIVVDTAPAGHLLRFLDLPRIGLEWTHALIGLMLKYKEILPWDNVADETMALANSIRRVRDVLHAPDSCQAYVVATPEEIVLSEASGLIEALEKAAISLGSVLINKIVSDEAADGCDVCRARRQEQEKNLDAFVSELGTVRVAPEQPGDVRGLESLRRHFRSWQPLALNDSHRRLTRT